MKAITGGLPCTSVAPFSIAEKNTLSFWQRLSHDIKDIFEFIFDDGEDDAWDYLDASLRQMDLEIEEMERHLATLAEAIEKSQYLKTLEK